MKQSVIGGFAILIAAGGFVLGRATAGDQRREMPPVAVEDAGASALREIRAELGDLKRSLANMPLNPSARSTVDSSSGANEQLDGLVNELQSLLARLSAKPDEFASSSIARAHGTSGYASRQAFEFAIAKLIAPDTSGNTPELWADAADSIKREHRQWRLEEVLARYGAPDTLSTTPSWLELRYDLHPGPNIEPWAVKFRVREGFVVETSVDH